MNFQRELLQYTNIGWQDDMTALPKYAKPKKVKSIMREKIYQPKPHPMQHRIDEFRVVPSLVTGGW